MVAGWVVVFWVFWVLLVVVLWLLVCFRFDMVLIWVLLYVFVWGGGGLLVVGFGVFACTLRLSVCGFGVVCFVGGSGGEFGWWVFGGLGVRFGCFGSFATC